MTLSIGIVGLPNVGKSTLFNALTKQSVDAANYPFCTIDPSVGIVPVPDKRLDLLSTFSQSEKTIPAVVEFVDIAGLVKGASEGEGLGNKFLSHIREVDAILEVVRIFDDEKIIHVHGGVNPLHDVTVINFELSLADLQTVTKRLESLEREIKRGDKEAVKEKEILQKIQPVLDAGGMARSVILTDEELKVVKSLHLLTMKPILYCLNKKIGGNNIDDLNTTTWQEFQSFLERERALYVKVDANTESELKDLSLEEKKQFATELEQYSIDNVIVEGYKLLSLMTYFTTGKDETRGWTVKQGSTAPEAGAAIHGDFRDRFIRAEIIAWDTLLDSGSFANARDKGLIRTEGKQYVVKDGDVIEFKV